MEDKKKNIRHVLNIIVILFITMLLVSGGTFAYFRWISSTDQQTNLAIQIEENINMHIENPLLTKAGMYPTNTCTNEAATMSGVSIIALENQTGVIARPKFKLRVKITDKDGNVITNNSAGTDNGNHPYRYFINYAVAEENGTCTEPLYSGNFDQNAPTYQGQTQWYDSEWITLMNETTGFPLISNGQDSGVSFNGTPYQTTYHNYKVWVWIDESYVSVNTGDVVSDKLQDAKIELSWSENSTVQQIKAQAYAVFSSSAEGGDDSFRFYQSDEPITEDSTYAGRPVTNVYTGFENSSTVPWRNENTESYKFELAATTVVVEDEINPISTAYWFAECAECSYFDLSKLNTSNVTNMEGMFQSSGFDSTNIDIIGLDKWDTSNVTNMSSMFSDFAHSVNKFDLKGLENWDVSNVTNMSSTFSDMAISATDVEILDLSNWNTYKVISNSYFDSGSSDKIIKPNWYTSYAVYSGEDNSLRFYRTTTDLTQEAEWNEKEITEAYEITNLDIGTEDSIPWNSYLMNIKSVVIENEIYPSNTRLWFYGLESCEYYDLIKLNLSHLVSTASMFYAASTNVETFTILGIADWDMSNVQYMDTMFTGFASDVTGYWAIDLSKWNTSNVTDMAAMFWGAGQNATYFDIGDISNWDVSNVTNMSIMFESTGTNTTNNWKLDLSNWDVSSVIDHSGFYNSTNNHIIPPNFND